MYLQGSWQELIRFMLENCSPFYDTRDLSLQSMTTITNKIVCDIAPKATDSILLETWFQTKGCVFVQYDGIILSGEQLLHIKALRSILSSVNTPLDQQDIHKNIFQILENGLL